ncbi:MAG: hypothetical protein JNM38_11515, partial [Acidobacteria bacterium]|nr:hypothetical protein [Acidobacteriota bacterium]
MISRYPLSPVIVATIGAVALCSCSDDTSAAAGLVCQPPAQGQSRMLVDHDAWRLTTPDEDPWVAHRPADDIGCPSGARKTEDFAGTYAWSVITADCPYTTVVQP